MFYKFSPAEKRTLSERGELKFRYGTIIVHKKRLITSFSRLPPKELMEDYFHAIYHKDQKLFTMVMEKMLR